MKLPRGRLVRRRVVADPATPLATALDEGLTGYVRLESQDALLLDGDGLGVITFSDGVPRAAYHTGTDRGGPPADVGDGPPEGVGGGPPEDVGPDGERGQSGDRRGGPPSGVGGGPPAGMGR